MFDLHARALGLKPIFWDTLAPARGATMGWSWPSRGYSKR